MNSRTRALEYSRMQECCDADLGARDFWFFLSSWVLECSSSCLLKLFSPKSSRIRRRFAMARLFPALRTRRSSKSGGGFSAQPGNSAATACIAHKSLRICERCRLRTPISLLLQTPLTSRCGGDLPQGFGTAAVTPRRLYRSVGALVPLRKVSSRFQNPAQNISVTPPHIDLEPRAHLYQAVP